MVIVLAVRFGRKPLVGLIDGMIGSVRGALDRAQDEQAAAARRSGEAGAKLGGLPQERTGLEAQTEQRIEAMRRDAALNTGQRLATLNRETEDRIRNEETLAQRELKRELVDQAMDRLIERLRRHPPAEEEADLIDQFVQQLEDGA